MGSSKLTNYRTTASEPGLLLVIEIRGAELLRQHPLLFPAAHHLQWNQDRQNQQQPRPSHPDEDSQDEHRAKEVNRIADARVDARRYQRRRLSLHAEGVSQLNARRYKQKKCRRCNRNPKQCAMQSMADAGHAWPKAISR